ncbi:sigma-70 family RNA polymerase sigma factor [Nonomuraea sp. FMUSA5-5]|uniref:Sigma-70 family RNA polymerase sigma factor n=1 Tax=Nonomuraea composti TaxID=2720023 RepID=A0ABX1BBC7_9ACTN|nr:sigma-70 family RNA polymerase sigma factor [Nonomuraea sp. FMUSA5-5]NJP92601.1 sigma-70 family RNA polymerase sigma factor [Nonomuraea sp. FMUSA5-5]
MDTQAELAAHFDHSRKRLRNIAYRMLGSADEADDATQEAWLRASSAYTSAVGNVQAWLTTIVARICLDMLRSRQRRREDYTDLGELDQLAPPSDVADPEDEAVLADSVGLALLVVLDTLTPAERVAFVLHDLFAVPFGEIAGIVERTPSAAKKLASRARQRVHGNTGVPPADFARRRKVVEAFLAASRAGDLEALMAVLAPDVVRRGDRVALPAQEELEVRGARRIAEETLTNSGRAHFAEPILVGGELGIVVAPRGRLRLVLLLGIDDDRITSVEVIGEPDRLRELDLALPGHPDS